MLSRWDPFAELAWVEGGRWSAPAVDIVEDDEAVLVKVELPGIAPEDVTIDSQARMLTIRGERKPEILRAVKVHRAERARGTFVRSFALPGGLDGSSGVAVMTNGVLTISIPKHADARS